MAEKYLFCPHCDSLLVGTETCPACAWRANAPAEIGEVIWKTSLAVPLISPCVIALQKDRLALPTNSQKIICLSGGDGKLAWDKAAFAAGNRALGITAQDGLLFCSADDSRALSENSKAVMALAADTGDVVWQISIPAHSLSLPAAHEGVVYVAANTGLLWALDARTGQTVWAETCLIPTPSPNAPLYVPAKPD